jgi:hypothetical protein
MNSEQESLIQECASAYLFNLVFIANEEDEGGFDYPLEPKYGSLSPMVESMLEKGILAVEDYEEDGESGQELVPGPKSEDHLEQLISTSNSYQEKQCQGVDALQQAFYLKMDAGELSTINESNGPWYQQITNLDFYLGLAPQAPTEQQVPKAEEPQSLSSFDSTASATPSAIEIQRPDLAPPDLPTKTYLYKKPAFIWLGITVLFLVISRGSSLFLYLSLIPAYLTVFFGYRKIILGPEGVTLISLAGKVHIPMEEVEETDLLEEDHEPESVTVTGRSGDSIRISKWSDDLRGIIRLLKNLINERN